MINFLYDILLIYVGFIVGLFFMNWVLLGSINNVNDINNHYWE